MSEKYFDDALMCQGIWFQKIFFCLISFLHRDQSEVDTHKKGPGHESLFSTAIYRSLEMWYFLWYLTTSKRKILHLWHLYINTFISDQTNKQTFVCLNVCGHCCWVATSMCYVSAVYCGISMIFSYSFLSIQMKTLFQLGGAWYHTWAGLTVCIWGLVQHFKHMRPL